MSTEINTSNSAEEITLKELILKGQEWFKYLLSKWYVLVLAGIIGGIVGFFYAKSKKPIYTATTTFVLESGESGGGLGQYAGMAAMVGIDLGGAGGGIFQGDNLLELYKSRKMIEAALLATTGESNKILLEKYLIFTKTIDSWKIKNPELTNIDFSKDKQESPAMQRQRDSVVSEMIVNINKNNLVLGKLDKKSAIIKVDVISEDEEFSKEFNEALVREVNDFYVQTKTKKSLDNIAILQQKADSVRAVMNGAISSAAVIMDATPNLNPTKQAQRVAPAQRSQFSVETNKAILGQLVQNLEMSKMSLLKESPLIQKVDEPIYPLKVELVNVNKFLFIGSVFTIIFMLLALCVSKIVVDNLK